LLERNLLETSLPPWNRTPGGQESAVYIRMDPGPGTPGLSVAFRAWPAEQVRYFGPYLGSLRARQAASALRDDTGLVTEWALDRLLAQ
jgi:excinuclease ABC subunit C